MRCDARARQFSKQNIWCIATREDVMDAKIDFIEKGNTKDGGREPEVGRNTRNKGKTERQRKGKFWRDRPDRDR
jgi:hypothetical protein